MKPWWERWPSWYDREIVDIEACQGIVVDEVTKESGRLILDLHYMYNEEKIRLRVICGAHYPFFPPSIATPGRKLSRHRGATREHMCFLAHNASGDHDWTPFSDTVAEMIETQVPEVLMISDMAAMGGLNAEELQDREMEVGEPRSVFLFGATQGGIIIDDYDIPANVVSGKITWWLKDIHSVFGNAVRGGIYQVYDSHGTEFVASESKDALLPRGANYLSARWLRAEIPESVEDKSQLWPWLLSAHPVKAKNIENIARKKGNAVGLLGVAIEEEVTHLSNGVSWIFFLATKINGKMERIVVPGLRASQQEMHMRVPELIAMRDKKILIIGLGSIGSPVAIQMARAGVEALLLVDKDIVVPGNTVRWALGMNAVGLHKAIALAEYISQNYPSVNLTAKPMQIGHPEASQNEVEDLISMINGVDLVIDATASIEVNQYISSLCKDQGVAYQWLSTTEGAYGGIIGRILPVEGHGCWMEYFRRLHEENIELPFFKEGDAVIPQGCITPTFTGAGIDCEQVGLFAARMALSTLCGNSEGGYPPINWDVGVFNFRTESGDLAIGPSWKVYSLSCPKDCPYCGM